jgi:hypothetical protein
VIFSSKTFKNLGDDRPGATRNSSDLHKYKIGDQLRFRGSTRGSASPPGPYRVTGFRPPENGEPCYRIKSDLERHERTARESELT